MRKPAKRQRPAMGQRWYEAIVARYGTLTQASRELRISLDALSHMVARGRLPSGENVLKLVEAFPEQFVTILTGRTLPEEAMLLGVLQRLSPDDQRTVTQFATLLATGNPVLMRLLREVIAQQVDLPVGVVIRQVDEARRLADRMVAHTPPTKTACDSPRPDDPHI